MLPARLVRTRLPALACLGALTLAGCSAGGGTDPAAADDGELAVVASFYPLQWLSEQIAGDQATVSSLTPAGAEPHEYELTPPDVAEVAEADVVVHLSTLQPSVDAAVRAQAGDRAFDAADSARLDLAFRAGEGDADAADAAEGAVTDPHFWHDPMRMADVGDALAGAMGRADPDDAAAFTANAAELRAQLGTLDEEFRAGLADCASRDIVTSHSAFGYLAEAFDLHQVGISGLAPDTEPSPSALTDATDFVRAHHVSTIYFETLVSPEIAATVARETGAQSLQLDPIEGLTDTSQGSDYLEIMRANLADLRTGQQCS